MTNQNTKVSLTATPTAGGRSLVLAENVVVTSYANPGMVDDAHYLKCNDSLGIHTANVFEMCASHTQFYLTLVRSDPSPPNDLVLASNLTIDSYSLDDGAFEMVMLSDPAAHISTHD